MNDILFWLASATLSALLAVGLLLGVRAALTRRKTHRAERSSILFDPQRGYRAVCFVCSTAVGEWRGAGAGFTPVEALRAAEAERDFHLWASH